MDEYTAYDGSRDDDESIHALHAGSRSRFVSTSRSVGSEAAGAKNPSAAPVLHMPQLGFLIDANQKRLE